MYWIVIFGILGQSPGTSQPRTVAEIRSTLNRIDDLSLAALDSLSCKQAQLQRNMSNKERYNYVLQVLKDFAVTKLHIAPPLQDIEEVTLEDLAKKASDTYYRPDPPPQPKTPIHDLTTGRFTGTMQQLVTLFPEMSGPRGWYDTVGYGRVWGWKTKTGHILFSPQEQQVQSPQVIYLPVNTQLMPATQTITVR